MLASGKHPFYQSKMTTEDYKRKIKTIIFPTLANSYVLYPFRLSQDFISRISKV